MGRRSPDERTVAGSRLHAVWLRKRPGDYAPFTRTQLELGFTLPAVAYVRAQQYRRRLSQRFLEVLGPGSP